MKIYFYIFIAIAIYFYIIKYDKYPLSKEHHIYFWITIATILLLCYLMKYHKFHLYKFFYNLKTLDEKSYYKF